MPLTSKWHEVAIRLALPVVAGGAPIGLDRGEHGRPAGLRVTLLVCLAASVAMIQANLQPVTWGKASDSFAVLDLMRLPLGILTGTGFIGAGAMIKRDGLVYGVTTAATALRWLDARIKQDHQAALSLTTGPDEPASREIFSAVREAGCKIKASSVSCSSQFQQRDIEFRVQSRASQQVDELPRFIQDLMNDSRVRAAHWKPSPHQRSAAPEIRASPEVWVNSKTHTHVPFPGYY